MSKKVKFVSPRGEARFPHLNKPDLVGKYADGKYKTKLVFAGDDPDTQKFIKQIDEALETIKGSKKATLYRPYTIDEDTGEVTFIAKTKHAPAIFDAKNRPARKAQIGNGSTLRLMGNLVEFDKGISAQINQVQIIDLNGFGSSAFDAVEDGYEFDPETDGGFEEEEATATDAGSDEDDGSGLDV